jgi:uncharacterized membrane protein YdfJ with MMPL/SSD domain
MRRLSLIVLALLVLASIAGCAGNSTSNSANPTGSDNTGIVASNADTNDTPTTAATNSEQGAVVIVKSANKLSSKEKEAVLNEISNELDTMIQTINTTEDISDEDLNF